MTVKEASKILRDTLNGNYKGKPEPQKTAFDMAIHALECADVEGYDRGVHAAISACAKLLKAKGGKS